MKRICFSLIVMVIFIASCNTKASTGVIGSSIMQPTYTPSCTPNYNFIVNLHAEGTPMPPTNLFMTNIETGMTVTATTQSTGLAFIKINQEGKWKLDIDEVKEYDPASYIVEPKTTPYVNVNYGIPSIELVVKPKDLEVPMSAKQIELVATYHSKMKRFSNLSFSLPSGILVSPSVASVRNDMDAVTFTMNIPKSFENYENGFLNVICKATDNNGGKLYSNAVAFHKNWNVLIDYYCSFMAVYDYPDNGHHVSYYVGVRDMHFGTTGDALINGTPSVTYVSASHWGNAPVTVISQNNNPPGFTGFGGFMVGAKIQTSGGWNYASGNPDNNGSITVRISDGKDLDIIRTFYTDAGWGITKATYDCLYTGIPIGKSYAEGTVPPAGVCILGTHFEPYRIWRKRN